MMLMLLLFALCAGIPTLLLVLPSPPAPPPPAPMFDAEDWRQMREHLPPDVYAWCREHA